MHVSAMPDALVALTPFIVTMLRRLVKEDPLIAADLVCVLLEDQAAFLTREKFLERHKDVDIPPAWSVEPTTDKGKAVWVLCRGTDGTRQLGRLVDQNLTDVELEAALIEENLLKVWGEAPNSDANMLELFPLNPLFTKSIGIERSSWKFVCAQFGIVPERVAPSRGALTLALTPESIILTVVVSHSTGLSEVKSVIFGIATGEKLFGSGSGFKVALDLSKAEGSLVSEEAVLKYWTVFAAANNIQFTASVLADVGAVPLARGGDA